MTYTPTSPTPLLDPVLKELGTEIISGKIPAGQRFTLQDLCTRFGISRTVAREVMRALEQLNLVHASRRVGITVLEKKDWAVFDKSVIASRDAPRTRSSAPFTHPTTHSRRTHRSPRSRQQRQP